MNDTITLNETEQLVISRCKELNTAVFENKDATALGALLAKLITYGHSNGNIHGRQQTLDTVAADKTIYSDIKFENPTILSAGNAMIIRHILRAETNIAGTISQLNLGLMLVWIMEDSAWKLAGRQAFRLQ
jgi:Domain of unknown function (DUF4440)